MKKKKYYWDVFYKNKKITSKETSFARFVLPKLKKKNCLVYDLGCGNGRDTIFFNKNKIDCIGIDKSYQAILNNKKKNKKFQKKYINANFCSYFNKKIIKKNFIIYCRFIWHSINYLSEKKLIKSIRSQKNLKYIYIEARTIRDRIYGEGKNIGKHEFITSHYRRFVDPRDIKKKLSSFSKIIYFKESINLAKFKKENPCVLRLIAKKK